MSESADAIIRRMHDVRKDVGDDVKDIVSTAKTLTDWRFYVKSYPWVCLAAALAAGYLVVPRRKPPMDDRTKELVALLKKSNLPLAAAPAAGGGILKSLLSAAAPALTRGALAMVSQRLAGPGGHARYSAAPEESQGGGINRPR